MNKWAKGNITLIAAFLLMVAGNVLLAYFIPRNHTYSLFTAFGFLFFLYYFICRQSVSVKQFYWLLSGALLLRFIWLFAFPNLSDDYARFIWDGRLSAAGYNPFKYLPQDVMQKGLRHFQPDTGLYNAMNSQTYYTCYPPFLQLLFALAAAVCPHNVCGTVIVLKFFNLLADVGSVLVMIALCKKLEIDKTKTLLFCYNPVVIAELTGNLHFEAIMIFFVLSAIYLLQNYRLWLSIILFALAVITKLVPLMLLPLVFFYLKKWKGVIFCTGVLILVALSWLPFMDAAVAGKFWSSIDSYFQESEYNASIYYLVRDITFFFTGENNIEIIGPVLTLLSGIIILVYAFIKRRGINTVGLVKYFTWTIMIYYAFTTTVFPWYLTPMIAFAVFTGYRFPLIWSAAIVLSYYTDRTPAFAESYPLIWIEYIVLAAAIIWDIRSELWQQKLVNNY